jgi:hypothetical protein
MTRTRVQAIASSLAFLPLLEHSFQLALEVQLLQHVAAAHKLPPNENLQPRLQTLTSARYGYVAE